MTSEPTASDGNRELARQLIDCLPQPLSGVMMDMPLAEERAANILAKHYADQRSAHAAALAEAEAVRNKILDDSACERRQLESQVNYWRGRFNEADANIFGAHKLAGARNVALEALQHRVSHRENETIASQAAELTALRARLATISELPWDYERPWTTGDLNRLCEAIGRPTIDFKALTD